MNIFVTSYDPVACARFLDDKRLIKMILESAQLLSTALNECNGPEVYKTTHKNHPCSIWVRQSRFNYKWLLDHFLALCHEYTKRFNKTHKCYGYYSVFNAGIPLLPDLPRTPFINCTPFKDIKDVHLAYRECLKQKWDTDKTNNRPAKWTNHA